MHLLMQRQHQKQSLQQSLQPARSQNITRKTAQHRYTLCNLAQQVLACAILICGCNSSAQAIGGTSPYISIKAGLVSKNPAGSLHFGVRPLKYLQIEALYAKYAVANNSLLAQAKAVLPLQSVIPGSDLNLFASLGGGWVKQDSNNSVAATYGLGAEAMVGSKVGISFSWQHLNHTSVTPTYNFFGVGTSVYFG